MANFYCEYCGTKYSNVSSLTASSCGHHPNGFNKGKHSLYEGGEKPQYTCKFCGTKYSSIQGLTSSSCGRHPDGFNKGKHSPAL